MERIQEWIDVFDVVVWLLVLIFFLAFALISGRDIGPVVLASLGVVLIMTVVGVSIEVIIDILKNVKGLGTILGFLTNGPELLVLIVGIVVADPLFGVSTPLGSNVANPVMFLLAVLITGMFVKLLQERLLYGVVCIFSTVILAIVFYLLSEKLYAHWLLGSFVLASILFLVRPTEETIEDDSGRVSLWLIFPALVGLLFAGYFLDSAVEFAGKVSGTPKGVIGFVVLATLSSWPEFKSFLVLLRRNRIQAASMNVFVSNITNIWLALIGVLVYLFF